MCAHNLRSTILQVALAPGSMNLMDETTVLATSSVKGCSTRRDASAVRVRFLKLCRLGKVQAAKRV